MKQLLTIFCLLATFISCNSNQRTEDSPVLHSKNLIAYIENPSQKGSNGLSWGRIVILDIDSQKKFYIKEKESYVNNPVWISDSKELVYLSEAESYDDPSYPLKFKYNQDIIAFNLKSRRNELLFPELEKIHQKFYMVTRKVIGFTKGNYLKPQLNEVFQITTPDYEISKLVELDSLYYIRNIDLSPDKNILIIAALELNSSRSAFIVYSLKDSAFKFTTKTVCSGGGWDISSENFLLCNGRDIRNYNCINDSIETLKIPVNKPSEVAYTKDGKIIGFARKEEGDFNPNEVFIFNLKDKKLVWLTNDKILKEKLNVLL
jgi:hypothetical protein